MCPSETAHIGLISNRNSGHNRDQFEKIKHLLAGRDTISHIETSSCEEIPAALRQFAEQDIDYLAINGGDGTVSAVLGYALEHASFATLPPVVLLPGGTANMNAGDIGARGKLATAAQRFYRWAESADTDGVEQVQRSLMRVQIGDQAGPHYGMFLGMGAIIQGTEYAHQEIHSRGLRDDLSVALGTVRTVWGLFRGDPRFNQSVAVSLCLNAAAEPREHQALIIAISSLQRLFLGMRPFWGKEPGSLRLTLIEDKPYRFLRTFISIVRGLPNRHATPGNGYFSYNANHISISMQGRLNLDGEILNCRPGDGLVRITASPAVTFLRL